MARRRSGKQRGQAKRHKPPVSPEAKPSPRSAGSHRATLPVAIALALITAAFFAQAGLHREFNFTDDPDYVTRNAVVREGLGVAGLGWAFGLHGHAANWHPLTWLSHMLDVSLFGLRPGLHKAVNVGLHAGSVALLFVALRRMTGIVGASALVALWFGIHPLRAESVVWVAERKDVLSAFLWMASLLAYVAYVERPGARRYGLLLLLFALGLMAKSMLVTLPLVLLLLDAWPLGRLGPGTLRARLREKAPLLALSALCGVVTIYAQGAGEAVQSIERLGLAQRLANAAESLTWYARTWLWPGPLGMYYPHRYPTPQSLGWAAPLASAAALVGVSAVAWGLRRRAPALGVGWLWYGLSLGPVIGILQVGNQAMADRYSYLPSAGLAVAVVFPVWEALGSAPRRRAFLVAAVAVLLLLCGPRTLEAVRRWGDNGALYAHSLRAADAQGLPRDGFLERILAAEYVARMRTLEGVRTRNAARHAAALDAAARAAELRPDDPSAQQTHAAALALDGRYEESAAAARRAVERAEAAGRPALAASGYYSLGLALLELGRTDEAREAFRATLRADPAYGEAAEALAGL